jgi:hypothetical protein
MGKIEARLVQPPGLSGIIEYHLKLGDKHLTVSVNRSTAFAETFLDTTDGQSEQGATTALYGEAKKLLQQEAAQHGPITYRMSTGFPSMKNWLRSAGESIFHWQHSYPQVDDPEKTIAETVIYPD